MLRKTVSGIMLTLLLIGVFTSAFNFHPVKSEWTGTVYIRADGSIDPPDAPIQRNGDVYTLTDNIVSSADGIVVERDNIVIDGAGHMLQGTGECPYDGILLWGRSNVTVKNTIVTNFWYGICLRSSSNNNITANNIAKNVLGIYLQSSSNNNIIGNNIANNWQGIYLQSSSNNNLKGNTFTCDGLAVSFSYMNSVENNTVNGKPLIYLEGVADYSISDAAGQVILVKCSNIQVENLNLSRTQVGVELWETNNSIISTNNITANNDIGIYLRFSSNNIIIGNNITANNGKGIYLETSSNNIIIGNNIAKNVYGLLVDWSSNNTITANNIAANYFEGILLRGSSNNIIYHNNFIENTPQVITARESYNIWNNDYPSGGNYWSNYIDVDNCSGPYQNETGSDGIWDHPYVIDENNIDRYPLSSPLNMTVFHSSFPNITLLEIGDVEFYLSCSEVSGSIFSNYLGRAGISIPRFTVGLYANSLKIGSVSLSFNSHITEASGGENNTLPVGSIAEKGDYLLLTNMNVEVQIDDLEPWSKEYSFTFDLTLLREQIEWAQNLTDLIQKAKDIWDLIQFLQWLIESLGVREILLPIFTIDSGLTAIPDLLNPDLSNRSLIYAMACPANLYIVTPSGLTIGTNPEGEEVNNVPNSFYSGKDTDPQIIWIVDAETGNYTVHLIANENGNLTCGTALISQTKILTDATQLQVIENQTTQLNSTITPDTITIPEYPSTITLFSILIDTLIFAVLIKRRYDRHN